jgi:hypothetical protein
MEDKAQQSAESALKENTLKSKEIPVPKRSAVMGAFKKIVQPVPVKPPKD